MPTKYTITLTSLGTSYVVAVPKPVVEGFGLEKGEKFEMYVSDDGIYIPLKASKLTPSQLKDLKKFT